jgi:hypothetical protein
MGPNLHPTCNAAAIKRAGRKRQCAPFHFPGAMPYARAKAPPACRGRGNRVLREAVDFQNRTIRPAHVVKPGFFRAPPPRPCKLDRSRQWRKMHQCSWGILQQPWSTGGCSARRGRTSVRLMDRTLPPGHHEASKATYPAESCAIIALALRISDVSKPSVNFPYAEARA